MTVPGDDKLAPVRMQRNRRRLRLGKAASGVLLQIPLIGADGGKELLHRGFVAREQPAIEMPWVPLDQHAAQIENSYVALGHLSGRAD